MATGTPDVLAGVRRVYQRLQRWRSTRKPRAPIPEKVWAGAVEAARQHGLFQTAQVLRLEYGKLKRRVDAAGPDPQHKVLPPAFVEVMAPQAVGLSECLIELKGRRGKMRIQWKGTPALDLAGLSRALWESA